MHQNSSYALYFSLMNNNIVILCLCHLTGPMILSIKFIAKKGQGNEVKVSESGVAFSISSFYITALN